MRVLIAGAGRAGLAVAVHLRDAGHSVAVIDRDERIARRAAERHGLVALAGDATDAQFLGDAEVERADVVGAMLRRDADNLAVALLAQTAGARRVMVRMRDPAYRAVYRAAGVQRVLSEPDVFVGAFGIALEHEAVRLAMLVGFETSVAFELVVPQDALVVGRTVAEIASDPTFPELCVFAGMYTENADPRKIRGPSVVEASMNVLLVAPRDQVPLVVAYFMRTQR
jgi:trk system potassium uptake protein